MYNNHMEDIIIKKHKKEDIEEVEKKDDIKKDVGLESGTLISWSAREYDHNTKTPDWYWTIGILSIGLIAIAIMMKNALFVILIMLSGFTIALYSARRPNMVNFAITVRGVQINNSLYPYDDLESFWMHYDPPHKKELGIISKKVFMPRIVIPLGHTDPNDVRKHLIEFLEEKHHEEGLSESIARLIGF